MAVTNTVVFDGTETHVVDVEATADGDTTATIPHTLSAAPQMVVLTNLQQAEAKLSGWAVTTIDGTNVVLTKSTEVGSGVAGDQVRVYMATPWTGLR